ncbi:MAG: hypothetical protein GXY82_00895 [Methanospirillum sp.]|nr:hypothetical protein [Methanospirillum sp.]
MNVRLVDIDSRIPNLALMQVSAYHKAQGDEVGFDVNDPDRVYVSCIFSKNAATARGVATMFPGADVTLGGSGLGYSWLPEAMQKIRPDYDLYPSEYSLGFTSRGCIRNCEFCIVRAKEGRFRRWQHPREFHDERFDTIAMLDNNILADKKWFFEVSDWCLAHRLKVDFMQGLDVRLLDEEIAERLKALRWAANIRFAFDHVDEEPAVLQGIRLLDAAGINLRNDVSFFVLAGFKGSTFEDALYRCRRLREAGTNAYVMRYTRSSKLNALARWANARQLFWTMDFADYTRKAVAP